MIWEKVTVRAAAGCPPQRLQAFVASLRNTPHPPFPRPYPAGGCGVWRVVGGHGIRSGVCVVVVVYRTKIAHDQRMWLRKPRVERCQSAAGVDERLFSTGFPLRHRQIAFVAHYVICCELVGPPEVYCLFVANA